MKIEYLTGYDWGWWDQWYGMERLRARRAWATQGAAIPNRPVPR